MASSRGILLGLLGLWMVIPTRTILPADDSLAQRRQRLESMPDAEKYTLLEKKRQFDQLSDAEQRRLREFHRQLTTNEHRDRLHKILERYDEWLKSLTPGQKARLLELPTDERVARVKEILREQETQRFRMMVGGRLEEKDLRAIRKWLDEFILKNESEILAALPKEHYGPFLAAYDSDKHRNALPFLIFRHPSAKMPRPTAADEARLKERVSREARETLASLESDRERSEVLQNWIRAASFSRMRPPVDNQELDQFAEKLDQSERERLENYPRERMYHELRRLYYQDQFRQMAGDSAWRPFPGRPPDGNQPRGPRFRRGPDSPGRWRDGPDMPPPPPGPGPGEPPPDRDRPWENH